jgi:ABC-type bacteriocin/lantibiotic exporter with double-glycine peptidase domain
MKFPIVRQQSEEDCGAACLATIAKYYGRTFNLARVREAVGTGSNGTTLLGLRRGAEGLGFNAHPVKATEELVDNIQEAPLPIVIHWKSVHWVVLYGKSFGKYIVGDPAVGIRRLSRQELLKGWSNGVMLMIEPNEELFYEQPNDQIPKFSRFLRRVLPYKFILLQAIVINIAIGLLALAMPILMQLLTDDVLVRGDTQLLATLSIGVIAIDLFRTTIGTIQAYLIGQFGQKLQLGLDLDYGFKLLRLPLAYFDSRRSGEIVSRIADLRQIHTLVSQIVLGIPSEFFIAVVSLGLMLFYSYQLTLASIGVFVLILGINLLFFPAIRHKTQRLIVEGAENQGFLVETVRGALVLKTTQATPQAWSEYQRNFGRLANLEWGAMKLGIGAGMITQLVSGLASIGLLWLGSQLVIDRALTIGQLMAFHGMSGSFLGFLSSVVNLVDEFITAQIVVQRVNEVLDATTEEDLANPKPWVTIPADADITCDNLMFHHSGRVDLLKDFNLTIPGGRVVALVGQSGCGKSTLTKLLAGLYPLQSGNIRYGDYNQQDISLESLRQQVVLVPQTPHFWSRSIIDNFKFAYPDITFEAMVRACKIASIDDFIGTLPDKYHTVLGEFGANISGGQQQRLAIARAIVTNPSILILDESTGALDPVLESQVLSQVFATREGKTTILISHRPRVILRSDFIVYLDSGELKLADTPTKLAEIAGEHLNFLSP